MNRDQDRYGVVYETADGHIRRLLRHIPSTDKAYRFWNVLLNRLEGKPLEEIGQNFGYFPSGCASWKKERWRNWNGKDRYSKRTGTGMSIPHTGWKRSLLPIFCRRPLCGTICPSGIRAAAGSWKMRWKTGIFPVSMRRHIERWVYRHCIYVDGTFLPARRSDIEDYIAKVSCRDGVALEEFFSLYQAFLQEHHIHDERLAFDGTDKTEPQQPAGRLHAFFMEAEPAPAVL